MIISEIGVKNFKSFGNSRQSVKLSEDKGQLILLVGNNGNGKSSLISSFDYALYGKCKGNKKKWSTLSTLPNRINVSDMLVDIKFISKGTNVEIKRGMSPSILELWENGIHNERAGKSNLDSKIEDYVDMDIETFKSFISMSIDSFKNFISLSTEEKQLLIDKLFNLEIINTLNSILKELTKSNKNKIISFESEIKTLEESIKSIQLSIEKSLEREKEDNQSEINKIKLDIESRKEEYSILKDKIQKIKEKELELSNELDVEKKQFIIIQSDIRSSQKDIDLYDSGKCPTCATSFYTDHYESLKNTLVDKKSKMVLLKNEIELNINRIKERQVKLESISEKANKSFNEITFFLKNCKKQIEQLEIKNNTSIISSSNFEFLNTISDLEEKRGISINNISISKEKEMYYKDLSKIFGEDGVKKIIISNIIKPINHFLSQNIKKIGLNFTVELDETFTAEIKHLGNIIDPESLSTGEHKLTNICILISYLMLVRTKKSINVLFLDEVFSSVDLENIQKILELLKSFANEYNINIFVVHHAVLNNEMFDKILNINKEVFSYIEEYKSNE